MHVFIYHCDFKGSGLLLLSSVSSGIFFHKVEPWIEIQYLEVFPISVISCCSKGYCVIVSGLNLLRKIVGEKFNLI